MPIYEYNCPSCNAEKEMIQSVHETIMPPCDDCGLPLNRLMSKNTFILNGVGWANAGYCNVVQHQKGRDAKHVK